MSEYLMYLRNSRQDDPNETIEEVLAKHERMLQQYALNHFGYRIGEQYIYREVVSGETIADRPMIQEVFNKVEHEGVKGVLVADTARLTRGDLMDCGKVLYAFLYTNTLVITPYKTFDLSIEGDRKLFEMELTRNSDYLEYAKRIMNTGRLNSQRAGNYIFNVAPYGYERIKIGKDWTLKINEKEAHYVRLIFELFAEGYGSYAIMNKIEELGATPRKAEVFTETVIRTILKNEVYIGKIKIGERTTKKVMENGKVVKKRIRHKEYEVVDGKHPPIIDEELFYKVQARIGKTTKEASSKELKNMWAGLIKCGKCGRAIEMVIVGKGVRDYKKARFRCKNVRACDNISHKVSDVEETLINELKKHLEDFTVRVEHNNQSVINERQNLLKSLNKQLEEVNKKIDAICEHLENGVYTVEMFVSRNNKLKDEKEKLEEAIKNTKDEIPTMQEMQNQLVTFHQTLDMLHDETIPAKVKNTFLKKIINVIYYTKDADGITIDVQLKI